MTDFIDTISFKAPAKLNLRLKVLGRRAEDGFHLLSMLNSTISLYDQLTVQKINAADGIRLETNSPAAIVAEMGDPSKNLAVRAAAAFFKNFGIRSCGLKITMNKNIPIGSGLGGGSSDAASVLKAMARIFSAEIGRLPSNEELAAIAVTLGSDVPYFVYGGLCRIFGAGEVVKAEQSNPLAGEPVLVILPEIHLSTADVYAQFRAEKTDLRDYQPTCSDPHPPVCSKLNDSSFCPDYPKILDLVENDLSAVVFRQSALCSEIFDLLKQDQNLVVSVTGSGSALFCLPAKQGNTAALKNAQKLLDNVSKSQIVEFI